MQVALTVCYDVVIYIGKTYTTGDGNVEMDAEILHFTPSSKVTPKEYAEAS